MRDAVPRCRVKHDAIQKLASCLGNQHRLIRFDDWRYAVFVHHSATNARPRRKEVFLGFREYIFRVLDRRKRNMVDVVGL